MWWLYKRNGRRGIIKLSVGQVISFQDRARGRKTFASRRAHSFEKEARLLGVCMSGCQERGVAKRGHSHGHWMRLPCLRYPHVPIIQKRWGWCSGPKLWKYFKTLSSSEERRFSHFPFSEVETSVKYGGWARLSMALTTRIRSGGGRSHSHFIYSDIYWAATLCLALSEVLGTQVLRGQSHLALLSRSSWSGGRDREADSWNSSLSFIAAPMTNHCMYQFACHSPLIRLEAP